MRGRPGFIYVLQLGDQFCSDVGQCLLAIQRDVFEICIRQISKVIRRGQGTGFGIIINGVTFVDGRLVLVIGAGAQCTAAYPAFVSVRLDGVDENVVGVVVVIFTQPSAHDSVFGNFTVQQHFDNVVKFDALFVQCGMQFFRLNFISWKTVQQPAVFAVILFDTVDHHGYGDIIRHQITLINIRFGFFAKFGAAFDVVAENRTGFNMGHVVFVFQDFSLGAFAAAVGAEK